jgi:hypothetical protein
MFKPIKLSPTKANISTGKGIKNCPIFKPQSVKTVFQSNGNRPGFCRYLKSPNNNAYFRADSESHIAKELSFLAYFLPFTSEMNVTSSDKR